MPVHIVFISENIPSVSAECYNAWRCINSRTQACLLRSKKTGGKKCEWGKPPPPFCTTELQFLEMEKWKHCAGVLPFPQCADGVNPLCSSIGPFQMGRRPHAYPSPPGSLELTWCHHAVPPLSIRQVLWRPEEHLIQENPLNLHFRHTFHPGHLLQRPNILPAL